MKRYYIRFYKNIEKKLVALKDAKDDALIKISRIKGKKKEAEQFIEIFKQSFEKEWNNN